MERFKLVSYGFAVSSYALVKQSPETRSVVHFHRVAQFVQKNILNQMLGQKHQEKRQIDVLPYRTTPPIASVSLYRHARIDETVIFGQLVQHFRQKNLSLSPEHVQYCLSEPLLALWSKRFALRIEEYRLAHFDANLIVFRPYRLQTQRKTVRMYAVRCVDDGFARFTVL